MEFGFVENLGAKIGSGWRREKLAGQDALRVEPCKLRSDPDLESAVSGDTEKEEGAVADAPLASCVVGASLENRSAYMDAEPSRPLPPVLPIQWQSLECDATMTLLISALPSTVSVHSPVTAPSGIFHTWAEYRSSRR